MKTIVVLKGKLYHIDNILPLVMELCALHIVEKPLFVLPSYRDFLLLRENEALYLGAKSLGTITWLAGRNDGGTGISWRQLFRMRLARVVRNIWTFRHFMVRPVLSLEIEDGLVLRALSKLNRQLYGGKRIMLLINNLPLKIATGTQTNVFRAYGRRPSTRIQSCDAIISSFEREDFGRTMELDVPSVPWIAVGYSRGLRSWSAYLDHRSSQGCCGDSSLPIIFFPLAVLHRKEPGGREYRFYQALETILAVLKSLETEAHTIFRYHPTTDRAHFAKILSRSGLVNCSISFEHPGVLMRKARLMLTYAGSTLAADAWFLGCPTVEFAATGASLHNDLGSSAYSDVTDYYIHDDPERLREVLLEIIRGKRAKARDASQRDELFHVIEPGSLQAQLSSLVG
jgi:hypothetical protein